MTKPQYRKCKNCGADCKIPSYVSVCSAECAKIAFPKVFRGKQRPEKQEFDMPERTTVNAWMMRPWRLRA